MARAQDNPKPDKLESQIIARRTYYLFHCSNGVHLVDLGPQTLNLDADISTLLDDLFPIVSPLRWRGICIEGNV
jgi:hypothetical protein